MPRSEKKRDTRHTDAERGLLETLLSPLLDAIAPAIERERDTEPFQRDPQTVRAIRPLIKAIDCYFDAELRGWDNLPPDGPFLLVANHSGGAVPVDLWPFFDRWVEEHGSEAPLYVLTYDLDFTYPVIGPRLRRLGMVPASRDNAQRAFDMGAPVVVFPGGDYEVFRPWRERNRINFGGRTGFVTLALTCGVPVVPMTIHGAHESTFVLTRGRRLARWSGLNRIHIKVFPFIWSIPLGLVPAFVPSVQLPAKITAQIGEPIDWSDCGPEAANDPEVVAKCYEQVAGTMQSTLDALTAEDPYPILTRLGQLRPDRVVSRALSRLWE